MGVPENLSGQDHAGGLPGYSRAAARRGPYLLLGSSVGLGAALRILTLLVAVTLVGTAATLLALGVLLAPVRLTSSALKRYLDDRTKPDLSIDFSDEAGS